MKGFGLWVFFLLVGAAFVCLSFSTKPNTNTNTISGKGFHGGVSHVSVKATNRKLKEKSYTGSSYMNEADGIHLEDYRPVDPVPSSKASIRPGPIQHGTPLMPFIPKPSPPPPTLGPALPNSRDFP